MNAGEKLPSKPLAPITQEQLRAYADASGDPNEIHLSEEVAKRMGLPGVIAHGMLIAGFLSERALELRDERLPGWRLGGFQIRFKAMTLLGDALTLNATVKSATESEVALGLEAVNQRGEVAAVATARLKR